MTIHFTTKIITLEPLVGTTNSKLREEEGVVATFVKTHPYAAHTAGKFRGI